MERMVGIDFPEEWDVSFDHASDLSCFCERYKLEATTEKGVIILQPIFNEFTVEEQKLITFLLQDISRAGGQFRLTAEEILSQREKRLNKCESK